MPKEDSNGKTLRRGSCIDFILKKILDPWATLISALLAPTVPGLAPHEIDSNEGYLAFCVKLEIHLGYLYDRDSLSE